MTLEIKKGRTIVVVGGVAGGASAAARLRRLNEQDEIIMLERGEHISFANCGLPYYIGGAITDRSKLLVQTVKGMSDRYRIDVRVRNEAVAIDRERQMLHIRRLDDGSMYEQPYDVLVLSPGAKPIRPSIEGIEQAKDVFTLRNIPDTDRIKAYVDEKEPKRAVVIGGGFIGVEVAENLRERGVDVTLVEMGQQVLNPIDEEMAAIVHQHLTDHGVQLIFGESVNAFEEEGKVLVTSTGRKITTDMTILAIGVQPESQLAKEAGLDTGLRGAIRVNEQLQTSDPHIYAVGDVIEVKDAVNGEAAYVPLAWGANRQGRLLADVLNGKAARYQGAYGTAIAKVFDLTVASTGNNEKTLKRQGIEYRAVHTHPMSHAGYYPGASSISMKLLFDPATGRILGAQGVGADGVDKRIDVIATAMKGGLLVQDLADLELSYAPPYSSAKDPVNMLGYIAGNMMDGLVDTVQWHEVDAIIAEGGRVIDVREPIEREAGYIPGTENIPLNELRDRLDEISNDQVVYVSCQVGLRGYVAARLLALHGKKVKNVDGGYKTYAAVIRNRERQQANEKEQEQAMRAAMKPSGGTNHDRGLKQMSEASVEAPSDAGKTASSQIDLSKPHQELDARGLQCPGPILQLYQTLQSMEEGQVVKIMATDPGFRSDVDKWCQRTGNELLHAEMNKGELIAYVQKGQGMTEADAASAISCQVNQGSAIAPVQKTQENATLVVFSGDLDKAIASFIIATGAASMGKKVTMFFTFWGLSILKRTDAPKTDKDLFGKMFSMMLPNSASQLPLSKMNFAGMGPKMIEKVMSDKNVDSLDTMIKNAQAAGVKFVACTMSMELMGVHQDELMPGVELGGVASYLSDAEDSGLNLFI
ncbi:FAD-dependent oxidoreductase [Paenibacillus aquistagni]|uniref:CoA-disulfide reductase n=1 Tax=Paenibacillus aquistagni TaxID=1852522 RepID=A0A1X7JDC4_9BACL|nr:FAD-dependent oxidoreductase [Paenibacillus aquistagni]SMG25627.1 CoA-disulfide reductase [Paenibacillus aquistagni]